MLGANYKKTIASKELLKMSPNLAVSTSAVDAFYKPVLIFLQRKLRTRKSLCNSATGCKHNLLHSLSEIGRVVKFTCQVRYV